MQAYCVKCRQKREMKDAKAVTMKNGPASNSGGLPGMWEQDVQNWQRLGKRQCGNLAKMSNRLGSGVW